MARIVIEDAVLYILSFYLVTAVIFQAGVFNSYFPGQKYDTMTNSLVAVAPGTNTSPSIFGDLTDINSTLAKYNTSMVKPGAMLDPIAVVSSVSTYIGLLTDMVQSSLLATILTPIMGAQWAGVLSFILNLMVVLVGIRVITGRIRWD